MDSEKIKEIKKLFKNCDFTLKHCGNCVLWKDEDCIETIKSKVLTLINELERDNESLVEERDLYKEQFNELEPRFFDLRDDNKELKDRIAELEKENAKWIKEVEDRKAEILHLQEYGKKLIRETELKQFAEKIWNMSKITVDATKHIVQGREYLHLDALKEIIKSCGVEIKEEL